MKQGIETMYNGIHNPQQIKTWQHTSLSAMNNSSESLSMQMLRGPCNASTPNPLPPICRTYLPLSLLNNCTRLFE